MTEEEKKRYIRERTAGMMPWELNPDGTKKTQEEQNPIFGGHERKSDPIRIKVDSHDIKGLLLGKMVSVKDVRGNEVQIIASDEGVDVYQAACDEALNKVRADLINSD